MSEAIRVLVVDGDAVARSRLEAALGSTDGLEMVRGAANVAAAVALAAEHSPRRRPDGR